MFVPRVVSHGCQELRSHVIERYTPPRIGELWSDRHRFELWLQIEILASEAWSILGRVPAEALPRIRAAAVDTDRIREVESRVGHDVIAFLTAVGETVGQPEARYLHLGLTSSDVVDTAFAIQLRDSAAVIIEDMRHLRQIAARLAVQHRSTVMAGRTHGIHAEPITFGFKVAGWVAELDRVIARIESAKDDVATGKLSGPVGTHASVDPRVEEHVLDALGLQVDPVSTQVVSRDRHSTFMNALAVAGGTLERIALEIRHLQRSEVAEALEPFRAGQKGSSSMPHKRNPELTERVCGLARVVRGCAATALENQALWHERDISHSSAERVIFPDACCLLDFMTQQMVTVLGGLEVHPERMARNLEASGGIVHSQGALLALVEAGMSREEAYRIVQGAAHRALDGDGGFRSNLEANPIVMKYIGDRMDAIFDSSAALTHVDVAFDRLRLVET